ncbi:MAG: matrixin family metalloprotease [Acidobacteriota bacterium]|nr:matrixin family metalloprotease [Acidobacteriota bacterium]
MQFKFFKSFSVFLLLFAFAAASSAYTLQFADEGKTIRLHWKNSVIPIALSSSLLKANPNIRPEADVLSAVRRSLKAWETVANIKFELTIVDRQSVSPAGKSGDAVNLITIAQTPENVLLFSNDTEEVSARTRTFFNGKGYVTEADVVLNPYQQFSTDGSIGTFDLEAVLTHEIGHLLGLEHSSISGATMFERQGKNGTYNLPSFAARTLAEDDIAGVRALYGAKNSDSDCCAAVNGKLMPSAGKTAKDVQVWLEEAETNRVIAGVLTNADGSFRLEGLPEGKYQVFAQGFGKNSQSAQMLGEVELGKGKTATFIKKIKNTAKPFDLSYVGFNGQISELAVSLNAGKSFLIYVGGKNLDAENLKIGFNSPNFSVIPSTMTRQDYGAEISVFSFEIKINSQTPAGEYSFFLHNENGENSYVVGGLTVESFANPWSVFDAAATE